MEYKTEHKKKPFYLLIDNDSLWKIFEFSIIKSLKKISKTCKFLNNEVVKFSEQLWKNLIKIKKIKIAPSILEKIGGCDTKDQISYINALDNIMSNNVYIIGGRTKFLINTSYINKNILKMSIDYDGKIKFQELDPLLMSRCNHTSIYDKGYIYSIFGLCDIKDNIGTIERFDIFTNTKELFHISLPNYLRDITSIFFEDTLFLIGGWRHNLPMSSNLSCLSNLVYTYDIYGTKEIEELPTHLNQARRWHATAICNGKLYVCGGGGLNNTLLRSVEVFDYESGLWQNDGRMIKPRWNFNLLVYKNEIYAIGGQNFDKFSIEKRNNETKLWELVTELPYFRRDSSASLVGDKIFVFGAGYCKNEKMASSTDYYDLISKKWVSNNTESPYFTIETRQMPRDLSDSSAVALPFCF